MIELLDIAKKAKSKHFLFEFGFPTCTDLEGVNAATKPFAKGVQAQSISDTMAQVPTPLGKIGNIDIVKDFRWTKTAKDGIGRQITPVVTLREYLVAVPAFFQNLSVIGNLLQTGSTQLNDFGQNYKDIAQKLDREADGFLDYKRIPNMLLGGIENLQAFTQAANKFANEFGSDVFQTQKFNFPSYIKEYERIYGVKKTNFIYRMPYLDDNFKSINNSWGGSNLEQGFAKTLATIVGASAPGIGIDFAKTFDYGDSGPSHNISFTLDNTRFDDQSEWARNFRLVYLLTYQNLPNRVNRSALIPPVIYQSSVPGVFSYRWSFLSGINIQFLGVRRRMKLKVTPETSMTEVVIPEGYQIDLQLTSLTPETKNLMFDAINNPVKSYQEGEDTSEVPEQ